MTREIHIQSYFSLPTDLAGQLGAWPEFVAGEGYTAQLKDAQSGEAVDVALVEGHDERPFVTVKSGNAGPLFDRVLGRVVYALSEHSDDLIVDRYA
jgi:hypothetical protein